MTRLLGQSASILPGKSIGKSTTRRIIKFILVSGRRFNTPCRFAAPLSRGELSPLLGEPALSLPKGDLGVGFLFALCKVEIQSSK